MSKASAEFVPSKQPLDIGADTLVFVTKLCMALNLSHTCTCALDACWKTRNVNIKIKFVPRDKFYEIYRLVCKTININVYQRWRKRFFYHCKKMLTHSIRYYRQSMARFGTIFGKFWFWKLLYFLTVLIRTSLTHAWHNLVQCSKSLYSTKFPCFSKLWSWWQYTLNNNEPN